MRRPGEKRILQIITWTLTTWLSLGWQGSLVAQTESDTADLLLGTASRNPAVAAVLELPLEGPADRLSAVTALLRLGETRIAAKLLEPLTTEKLSDDKRAALVAQFGSATFLQLARLGRPRSNLAKKAAPPSATESGQENLFAGVRQFAEACMKAAEEKARDPVRIARLIEQLADASPARRRAALVDLQTTGIEGVRACMHALASHSRDPTAEHRKERAQLLLALASLRPTVEEPLLAALAAHVELPNQNDRLGRDLAELTGHLELTRAVPWLAHMVTCGSDAQAATTAQQALASMGISKPSPSEVRALAAAEIARLCSGSRAMRSDASGRSDLSSHGIWWTWSPSLEQAPSADDGKSGNGSTRGPLMSDSYRREEIYVLAAARLARIIPSCGQPSSEEHQLALIYAWQSDAITGRDPTKTTEQLAASLTTDQLSATLAEAIRRNHLDAACQSALLLGKQGDRSVLVTRGGRPTPLACALKHANDDLRFAALSAIIRLGPDRSFTGSSYLPDVLWNFATGSGPPQAVVVSPVAQQSSTWAGQLRTLDYETMATFTGQEALAIAFRSPRLALVLLDARTGRPSVREVLYQLRSIPHAGRIPVAVVSDGSRLPAIKRLTHHDPYLLAAVRPSSKTLLVELVEQLENLAAPPLADEQVRSQRASQALTWIAALLLSDGPTGVVRRKGHLVEQTLDQPELVDESLQVLTHLGTADSQRALLDYASSLSLPIENRQDAAKAFAASVRQFGILLTTRQIVAQYDRYNASRSADSQTQQLQGNLLDVLESQGSASSAQ